MKTILIADEIHPSVFSLLAEAGFAYDYQPDIRRAELIEAIGGVEGLFIRSKTFIDAEILDQASNLQYIGRAGAGLDLIDLDECERRGIQVFGANEGNRDAVAEHAVGMLLTLFNHLNRADAQVRQHIWDREGNRGLEVMGKTVGIIGYGNNGRAFARRLSGFGVRVLAYDKYNPVPADDPFAQGVSLPELLAQIDILSLHIPLTTETLRWVNTEFIESVGKPFFLLNLARGEIVVLADLLAQLQTGKVRGACLDVLENEKLDRLTPGQSATLDDLMALPNVVFSPHVAGWTHESYVKINEILVRKLSELDAGR